MLKTDLKFHRESSKNIVYVDFTNEIHKNFKLESKSSFPLVYAIPKGSNVKPKKLNGVDKAVVIANDKFNLELVPYDNIELHLILKPFAKNIVKYDNSDKRVKRVFIYNTEMLSNVYKELFNTSEVHYEMAIALISDMIIMVSTAPVDDLTEKTLKTLKTFYPVIMDPDTVENQELYSIVNSNSVPKTLLNNSSLVLRSRFNGYEDKCVVLKVEPGDNRAEGDGDNRADGDGDNRAKGDGDNRAKGDGDNRAEGDGDNRADGDAKGDAEGEAD
ncbi:MAG: hypothetical protein KatS3mg101_0876 [Patescibacteria group bacterium]|nr:MAG: hypothetical protein KatS3mg101_0876 [Patescibacteria group bacterium]